MIDNKIVVETENLVLRKFEKTDFRNFASLHQSSSIMKYFEGGAKTIDQTKKRFGEVIAHQEKYGFSYYNVFLKDSGEYIGQTGLYYNYDMSVNLCYAFLEQYQHKGYAIEAVVGVLKYGFEKLNFSYITSMSAPENKGSVRVLEKIGGKFLIERKLSSGITAKCFSVKRDDFYDALKSLKLRKYRKAVGAILINEEGKIYLFNRSDFPGVWQGPEGGVDNDESPLEAVYREIKEEVGVTKDKLHILGETRGFFRYNYPNGEIKHGSNGQEKKFFLFRFLGNESGFSYDFSKEFTGFKLVGKSEVAALVPEFKREVYISVLKEFDRFLR